MGCPDKPGNDGSGWNENKTALARCGVYAASHAKHAKLKPL
jgi:hypothetical protein